MGRPRPSQCPASKPGPAVKKGEVEQEDVENSGALSEWGGGPAPRKQDFREARGAGINEVRAWCGVSQGERHSPVLCVSGWGALHEVGAWLSWGQTAWVLIWLCPMLSGK